MQIQVDIGFEQLVKIAKRLPENQWTKLKEEVEKDNINFKDSSDLESLILSAPTFDEGQLNRIEKTRKAINQWRKK
ncbi:hypothetical protein [Dyadobacter sp. CY356]|uniref:hypothetical protein n=1 Tax=Dyadobacter sp. CY356 TaxID=2906442 RepID=UPI001F1F4E29|nr:hypothetical protein [Dyadobacter sp. CY356]MCF0058433.1 hypothetical protein [Dyadobacter sp. CY356]